MLPLLKSLRPRQWSKNVVIFAGLAFSGAATDQGLLVSALTAFAAFCLASSAVYIVNDIFDRERDRLHPIKRHRPIASGTISVKAGILFAIILVAASLFLSSLVGTAVWAIGGYLVLQALYTPWLKHVVLLDVFSIAAGFSLRVLGGAWAIEAPLSPWLVACTVQLALFLALCKRRAEAANLSPEQLSGDTTTGQRPILAEYAGQGTDMMVGIMAAATLVTFTLYTLLPASVLSPGIPDLESRAGEPGMVFTLPFVFYGVLRYLHLVYSKGEGERPERIATMDPPMIIAGLGFVAVAGGVIYF